MSKGGWRFWVWRKCPALCRRPDKLCPDQIAAPPTASSQPDPADWRRLFIWIKTMKGEISLKRFYIYRDGIQLGSAVSRESAVDLIHQYQAYETHPILRAQFSMIEGEEEFIPYPSVQRKPRKRDLAAERWAQGLSAVLFGGSAWSVCHSLVVLVMALSCPFGYTVVTIKEGRNSHGSHKKSLC